MSRKTEKGGKFRNVHCRTWYAETDNPNIDVETYDRYDIFARLHFAVDDFYEKTHHTKLHEIKEHANDIATDILDNIEKYIKENPTFKGITRRYAKPNKLTPDCIAQILLSANIFGRFKLENNTYLLGMYQEEGPDVGIYKLLESEDDCLELYRLMFEFDPGLKKPEREEIKQKLLIDAPLKKENSNPKLIALNNGIWFCSNNVSKENMDNFFLNYRNSESREFVFTKKIRTDFNRYASNKPITTADGREWTKVVDLTEKCDDPVDLLFGFQLGGGTDINQSVAYCQQFIEKPQKTLFFLVSDLYEGGNRAALLRRMEEMKASGVQVVSLLAIADGGRPYYDTTVAGRLAALGIPCFACNPQMLPELLKRTLKGEDLTQFQKELEKGNK